MGLFGGGNKSTKTTNNNEYVLTDNRLALEGGAIGVSGAGANLALTDSSSVTNNSALTTNNLMTDSRQFVSTSSTQDNDYSYSYTMTSDKDVVKSVMDFANVADATAGKTLDSLISLSRDVFYGGMNMLADTQTTVDKAYGQAYAQAADDQIDKAGRIDTKTMIVFAGLAALVIWSRK